MTKLFSQDISEQHLKQSSRNFTDIVGTNHISVVPPLLKKPNILSKRKEGEPVQIRLTPNKRSVKKPRYLSDYKLSSNASDSNLDEGCEVDQKSIRRPLIDHDYGLPSDIDHDRLADDYFEQIRLNPSVTIERVNQIVLGEDKKYGQVNIEGEANNSCPTSTR